MSALTASRLARASGALSFVATIVVSANAFAGPESALVAMVLPHVPRHALADERPQREPPDQPARPRLLTPLYVTFATLQVLDAESTLAAMERGSRETNPLMLHVGDNRGAMLAIKAAATLGTILAVERLWKVNRRAAVITMIGVNVGYALVVANNVRHARRSP